MRFLYLEYGEGKKKENRMATLGTPSKTMEILQKYNFNIQKKYGQNFLIEPQVLQTIVQAADIRGDDCVLEIGPGIGTMTQYLAEAAGKVVAVEIDKSLLPILDDTLAAYGNVTVLNEDILKIDIHRLIQDYGGGKEVKVAANLPYYITTPIIMRLLESRVPITSITVMVQTEVAERMRVGPGTKDYGALSLAVQYYAKPEIVTHVPPSCFIPRPGVGSTVIRLERYAESPVSVKDDKFMFSLIRAAFNQRRKTLANALANASGLSLSRARVQEALGNLALSETIRGEALTLREFAALSDLLTDSEQEK